MSDLNVVNAAEVAVVADRGVSRRGRDQRELDLIADGAVAIRGGRIEAVGRTRDVLNDWEEDGVTTLDASGKTVLPGLIECHSHPLFSGKRHAEYQLRLDGASLGEIAAAGGGIWSTVVATREASDQTLTAALDSAYARILAAGVTTLEVKSGYGLTPAHELHQLELLDEAARSRRSRWSSRTSARTSCRTASAPTPTPARCSRRCRR